MTKSKMLKVTDSSCTLDYPLREHAVRLNGDLVKVVFKFGEEKIVPYELGLKFNGLEGFNVEFSDGEKLPTPVQVKESVQQALKNDECVAKFSELTIESLKIRAARKKGGEMFLAAPDEARNDIIGFLIGQAPAALSTGAKASTVDDEDDLIEDDGEGPAPTQAPAPTPVPTPAPAPEPTKPAVAFFANDPERSERVTKELNEIVQKPAQVHAGELEPQQLTVSIADDDAIELAAGYGINLEGFKGQGSGDKGLILKTDVSAYIESQKLEPVKK